MAKLQFVDIIKLVVSIVVCQGAGFIGSIFTTPAIATWYAGLAKPPFSPPNWLFGPVWISLFLLMGIALFFIWRQGVQTPGVVIALIVFAVQLVLNILWSFLFFKLQSPLFGFIEIVILWVAIILTILSFARISRTAAFLLIPYIVWVSFAAVLNYSLYKLNP